MRRLCVAMFLMILFSMSIAHAAESSLDVKVTAAAAKTPTGSWLLRFSMINSSDHPVRIFEADLPWGIRTSLTLLLTPVGIDQSPLEMRHYIDDPGPKVAVIAAHSGLVGDVNLDSRCLDLGKATENQDIIVFWSYEPCSVDGICGARDFGGALLKSRSKGL